jgi:hypothetical protein
MSGRASGRKGRQKRRRRGSGRRPRPRLPRVRQHDLLAGPRRRRALALLHGHEVAHVREHRLEVRHFVRHARTRVYPRRWRREPCLPARRLLPADVPPACGGSRSRRALAPPGQQRTPPPGLGAHLPPRGLLRASAHRPPGRRLLDGLGEGAARLFLERAGAGGAGPRARGRPPSATSSRAHRVFGLRVKLRCWHRAVGRAYVRGRRREITARMRETGGE